VQDEDDALRTAAELFREAYAAQMKGELDHAIELYQRSIAACPTAEAHTFLGWTFSFLGRLDDAIAECHKAIGVDPRFGNPYNDIGAYLIEMDRLEDAIPWLERATRAERYESPHFPLFNLGRVYVAQELYNKALACFRRALELKPDYEAAREAIEQARVKVN
jgi:tetratricopeptide (TPR) repeat protein